MSWEKWSKTVFIGLLAVFLSVIHAGPSVAECFKEASEEYDIPEKLLVSIAEVESSFHPFAINYRYYRGGEKKTASFYPESREKAEKVVRYLWDKGYDFDLGIGQINSRNMKRFDIDPDELLNPCYNLRWSAFILKDNIDRHGFNWKAVAAYNGSSVYSWKIFRSLMNNEASNVRVK